MIKLPWDPDLGTAKKPSASTKSTVAKLLMRWRGRSAAAKDESIEFFSELRNSQPDLRPSEHAGEGGTPDGRGNAKRAAAAATARNDQLLTTGTGKHDYDWLLTPPASPLWSPATSAAAGHRVAAPPPSRLERASSAPYAKGNSRLPITRRENGTPASRLARSSSATSQLSAVHAAGTAFSGRPPYGRTLSSASVSSLNAVSNASVSSTPRGSSSSATSPRTPATARSGPTVAAAARHRHRDRTQALHTFGSVAAGQPNASSGSRSRASPTALTTSGARPRATPGAVGTSSPRSTTAASHQPVATRRGANSVARSGPARQSAAGSTAQAASPALPPPPPRDVNVAAGASSSKPRQVPSGKQRNDNGMAVASTTAQRWRPAPPTAAAVDVRNTRREEPVAHGSSRNRDSCRKIDVVNTSTAARCTVEISSSRGTNGGSPTSAGGRNKSTDTDAKRRLWQGAAARHLIAAAGGRDTTPTRRSGRSSVASRSRLGIMSVPSSGAGSTTGRPSTPAKGKPAAAAAASPRVAVPDAFPSTRYDAMLLREDPRNLTWLHGCDDDDEIGGGGLVEATLESFDLLSGSSCTAGQL